MTTTRSYRQAMSFAAASEELERCAGFQLDPHVVDSLLAVASRGQPDDFDAPDAELREAPMPEPAHVDVYAAQM